MDDDDFSFFSNKKNITLIVLIFGISLYILKVKSKLYLKSKNNKNNQKLDKCNEFLSYLMIKTSNKIERKKIIYHVNREEIKNEYSLNKFIEIIKILSTSLNFEIFLLIKIKEGEKEESFKEQLSFLISNEIVKNHRILFCSTYEGITSIIRSINPSIVIDFMEQSIINTVRFVNEMWIISSKSIQFPENYNINARLYYLDSLDIVLKLK